MRVYTVKVTDIKTYKIYYYQFEKEEDMNRFLKGCEDLKDFEITIESREKGEALLKRTTKLKDKRG